VGGTAALPLITSGSVPHVPVKKSASAYRLLFSDYQAVYNSHALIPHQMKIDSQLRMIPAKVLMNSGWSDTSLRQNPYKQSVTTALMNNDLNFSSAVDLFAEILSQENILLSVNSGSGICEARVEKGLPFRIREKWATIGEESGPWHIHLNMEEISEARFVKEARSDGRQSYSIRFFDSKGKLAMRANFIGLYGSNGNLIKDKTDRYDEIHRRFGSKDSLLLKSNG
jgi:putative heme iron utilization protein